MNNLGQGSADDYLARLGAYLPQVRVEHSLNVARAARELAELHCPDLVEKAWVAGLLHDNAKYMAPEELLTQARELGVDISPAELETPGLLHGKIGAVLLAERFGVSDAMISAAVADHVTGRPGMGPLSLVLFVADQSAADRDFDGVDELRDVAPRDLFKAAAMVSRYKLMYILASGKPIIMETVALYNELQSRLTTDE